MLQQTQVATVIPYYKQWLKVFPSLSTFARAPLSKALKCWAGLGYYRRVRMFHRAGRHVQRKLGGKIPQTAEALVRLPGIGRYTAGAIASIALGEKTPVLDGNVIRILTRIFAIPQSVDRPATLERLWTISASLLPDKKPGDLNQALMELGATVCLPQNPQCSQCPVKKSCAARRQKKRFFFLYGPGKTAMKKCVWSLWCCEIKGIRFGLKGSPNMRAGEGYGCSPSGKTKKRCWLKYALCIRVRLSF